MIATDEVTVVHVIEISMVLVTVIVDEIDQGIGIDSMEETETTDEIIAIDMILDTRDMIRMEDKVEDMEDTMDTAVVEVAMEEEEEEEDSEAEEEVVAVAEEEEEAVDIMVLQRRNTRFQAFINNY